MIMLKIKNNESSVSLVSKDKIPVWLECRQSWSVEPPPCRTSLAPRWSRLSGWPKWSKDYHNDVEGADKHCLLWAPWWETAPTSQSQVAKVVWMSIYKPVADVPQRNKHIHIKVVQKLSQSCPKAVPVWMITYKPVVGVPLRYKHIRPKVVWMNIYNPKSSQSYPKVDHLQTCGSRPSEIQTYSPSSPCLIERNTRSRP